MREKFTAHPEPLTTEAVGHQEPDRGGRAGEGTPREAAFSKSPDPLALALTGLRPDGGLTAAPESVAPVPAAGSDDLDLSGLEADGRDWAGFSVDQDFSEDSTLIASATDDFSREVTVPATGRVLTRRDLLADLLRVVVANLNTNHGYAHDSTIGY